MIDPIRQKLSELSPLQIDNLFIKLFDTPDGQLVLARIKEIGYIHQTTAFVSGGGVLTQTDMNVREGMRIMALQIDKLASQPYQKEDPNV